MSPKPPRPRPGGRHPRLRWHPPAGPPPAEPDPQRRLRIERLRDEVRRVESRWQTLPQPTDDQVRGLEIRIDRRRTEIDLHRRRIAEASAAITRLEGEIAGMERAVEAFLVVLLGRMLEAAQPHWSPTPLAGFRAWAPVTGGLRGARVVWEAPRLAAYCARGHASGDSDIPHSDGSCGVLGCGIYAVKDPRWLASVTLRTRGPAVFGVVMLSGKVVEHERGYRAAKAEVAAVTVRRRGQMWASSDPACVERLFADPGVTMSALEEGAPDTTDGWTAIEGWQRSIDYLADEARRLAAQWT